MIAAPNSTFVHGRLVGEEIAAEDRLVEVHPLAVTLLAGDVVAGVDAALGADAVAALHRHHREQIDVHAFLGQLHGAGQAANPPPTTMTRCLVTWKKMNATRTRALMRWKT
jgi:hypothetical protein